MNWEQAIIFLDGLIDKLRKRSSTVSSFWLKAIGKRLRKLKGLDPSDAAGIAAIRNDRTLLADLEDAMRAAGEDTVKDAKALLKTAARLSADAAPVAQDLAMEEWISGVAEAAQGELRNIAHTSTVAVVSPNGVVSPGEAYVRAVDEVAAQLAGGEDGLRRATRKVCEQFADAGLSVVEYESGRVEELGAATERNLKQAVHEVYQGVQRRVGQEYGADGVEISAHADCAPDHLEVQGQQFTNEEYEKVNGALRRKIGTWNCRHVVYSIIVGVTPPTYSPEELAEMRAKATAVQEFDGKQMTVYEATQVQRRLEREIRKQKNRTIIANAAGEEDMRQIAQTRINYLTEKYKELSDSFGLKTQAGRMSVKGYQRVEPPKLLPSSTDGSSPLVIPPKTNNIDFERGGFQNVGTAPDMTGFYDPGDPGREFATSRPVIYNDYAARHLKEDDVHSSRLPWIKANEADFVRAIEHPEFVEISLRARKDGYYSATHIVKVTNPTSASNQYMAVAISYSKDKNGGFHQITTIHPKKERDILRADGTVKPKYRRV